MSNQRTPPFQADDSSSNDSTPAGRLRELLQRAELSQRGAARLLGVEERTMRQWCAGQGVPPESVYRALDPRLTYTEHLRQRIEQNERMIDSFENGRFTDVPRDYQPRDAEAARQEIAHLRKRNEEHRSILRLEETIDRLRDAYATVYQQWQHRGVGPALGSLAALDLAEQEFQSAKAVVNQITEEIRTWRRL
jgi:transcriptional regulator with XRE-family HTH domain